MTCCYPVTVQTTAIVAEAIESGHHEELDRRDILVTANPPTGAYKGARSSSTTT